MPGLTAPPPVDGRPPLKDFDPNSDRAKRDILSNVLHTKALLSSLAYRNVPPDGVVDHLEHTVTSLVLDGSMPSIVQHLQENNHLGGNNNDMLATLRNIQEHLAGLDRKVNEINHKVNEINNKVDAVDRKVDAVDRKVDVVAVDLQRLKPHVWKLSKEWAQYQNVKDLRSLRAVPFQDGTWPSDHGLPPLENKEDISNLSDDELYMYTQRYREDMPSRRTRSGQIPRADLEKMLFEALGVNYIQSYST